jgi:threonylcarbamoyladenosine tRNA methylthiotransferase CDKAL1
MRIHIKTFGCTANKADSLKIKQLLTAYGHTFSDKVDLADLVVVNTCVVTQTTQRKMLKFIRSISESGRCIVVAGCLPATQPETLAGIKCTLLTPSSLNKIAGFVNNSYGAGITPPSMLEGVSGIVSISQGCVGHCSYCIVKQARGKLVSRPIPDIVREVELLLKQGAMEIQLTSQDISAYGMDTGDRLPVLLGTLTDIEGNYMIRVGMMNPFTMLDIVDDMVDLLQNSHVFKFLHIPVQSGSDRILKHMNRRYTTEDFKYIVQEFRKAIPEIHLSTDFIVGYPIETEQDFNDTLALLEEIRPQKVNITRYSQRPNTQASLFSDMPEWIKKERSRSLTKHHHLINKKLFQSMVGNVSQILTTEPGRDNSTVGRDIYYYNIVVQERLPLGNWYNVKITESRTTYLMSEKIPYR